MADKVENNVQWFTPDGTPIPEGICPACYGDGHIAVYTNLVIRVTHCHMCGGSGHYK